jgi:isoleucyl-tRNA synthetase
MLGTLHHARPDDVVAFEDMPELERLMLHELAQLDAVVRPAYADFDYKTVVASVAAFMNAELSAFYFDIRKDTLYCDPPSSRARKAALTTVDILCDTILKWLAPVLSFTSDEAWANRNGDSMASVHLTTFPTDLERYQDDALAKKWDRIRDVRRVVTGALEIERAAKRIGSSLEASPVIYVADRALLGLLADVDLAEVCITSNYEVQESEAPAGAFTLTDVPGVAVVVELAVGTKCARSWRILPTVGSDPEYPEVSPRDANALREWRAMGVDVGRVAQAAPPAVERTLPVVEFAPPVQPAAPASSEAAPQMKQTRRVEAAAASEPKTRLKEPASAPAARKASPAKKRASKARKKVAKKAKKTAPAKTKGAKKSRKAATRAGKAAKKSGPAARRAKALTRTAAKKPKKKKKAKK